MSLTRATRSRAGADAILHPQFLRERLAPVLDSERRTGVDDDHARFERLRAQAGRASASVGAPHEGPKGRAVHRVKSVMQRALYWYVDPPFDALRATNIALLDIVESLSDEVEGLRAEVASLRRDHDTEVDARRSSPGAVASLEP